MPKAKTVEKKEVSKTSKAKEKKINAPIEPVEELTQSGAHSAVKSPRIQTAEGWKRSMLKSRK